ncbi:hypothetical protein LZC95_45180 [Pendulispora brunnea]|uniref:Poly(3-hydroxybutyrate) depolymerase n=1 Tax=Pendulispora brunnea TaxID=2905690 RepID=A0ABZ2K947_9BACT
MRGLAFGAWALALAACFASNDEEVREQEALRTAGLPALNIDVMDTSVSGLSSGAYMAVQFHVAYSSILRGAGIFAGGPFYCAEGSLNTALTTCMTGSPAPPDPARAVDATKRFAAAGTIDDPANLARQRVFLFGGAGDTTVVPPVMDALESYYRAWNPAALRYEKRRPGTAHLMPTVAYGGDCSVTGEPWIGRCNYDGAGLALAQIYGSLEPPASLLSGRFVSLEQATYLANPAAHSVADTGYAYIPAACEAGARCRVHVAFHGCKQYASGSVGDRFYKHAGYNEWADTNRIVVVYPQTIPTSGTNPNGCWDWWGYDSPNYATRAAPQMAMVRRMIDALAGAADAGDAGDGGAADAARDSGATCFVANNYEHVTRGRAHLWWGYALANGSNQNMGLYSVGIVTSLRQVGADHYVIGTCP